MEFTRTALDGTTEVVPGHPTERDIGEAFAGLLTITRVFDGREQTLNIIAAHAEDSGSPFDATWEFVDAAAEG